MEKIGRNEPCPCGSGRKVKRCCGTEGVRERLERAEGAIEEAFTLATHFPRLRAHGRDFDRWVEAAAARSLEDATVEDGVAALADEERRRIVRECIDSQQSAWRSLVDDVGDQALAVEALVAGAVVAAVDERLPPPLLRLSILEVGVRIEPAEALALVLRAADVWSVLESVQLENVVASLDQELEERAYERAWDEAVAAATRGLLAGWHRERLSELVQRMRAQLPFEPYPKASAAIAAACDEFERDAAVRERLGALLLEESLARLPSEHADAGSLPHAA